MEKKPIFEYIRREDGTSDFEKFLDSLSVKDAAKLLAVIEKTEKLGISIAIRNQWVKKIENNLFELRSKVDSNIQRALHFHVVDDRYVILMDLRKKQRKSRKREATCARSEKKI